MQLLIEEFFRKSLKFINSLSFTFRFIVKLLLFIFLLFLIVLMIILIYTKNYIWVIIILGIVFLAEIAHFIRKFRERKIIQTIEGKKDVEETILKPKKSKNKDLLGLEKPKNKRLLSKK